MPGKERSLGLPDARVERSIIGDGPVKCLSQDHLVLPLRPFRVHIRHVERCTHVVSVVYRVVYRGVYRGVYRRGVHTGGYRTSFLTFTLLPFQALGFLTFLDSVS